MFQQGYNLGFKNGHMKQPKDCRNEALYLHQDISMWEEGYLLGYSAGWEYRTAKAVSETLLTRKMLLETQENKRREQKHSSVFWFFFWSIGETVTRFVQTIKSVW